MVQTLAGYGVATFLVTILPGPDSLLVMRYAAARGRRSALVCGAGIAAGLFVWGVMTAVGLAALIVRAHPVFVAVRIAGALYLLWLAVALWRRGGGEAKDRPAGVLGRPFPAGLVSDLANPKTAAFFLAVFPGFLPAGVPHAVGGVVLASITAVLDLLWLGFIALAVGTAARPLTARIRRRMERASAVVLAAAGARMLTE